VDEFSILFAAIKNVFVRPMFQKGRNPKDSIATGKPYPVPIVDLRLMRNIGKREKWRWYLVKEVADEEEER